eukprot:s587_g4.t3
MSWRTGLSTKLNVAATKGNVPEASAIFEQLWTGAQHPSATMFCNTMLKAYANAGDFPGASRWEMRRQSVRTNAKTLGKLIESAAKAGQAELALEWLAEKEDVANPVMLNTVLHAFARSAACTEAEAFLSRLPEKSMQPNAISFNTVIACYSDKGLMDRAEDCLGAMKRQSLQPTLPSYNALLQGFARASESAHAVRTLARLVEDGLVANGITSQLLVSAFTRSGDCATALLWLRTFEQCGITAGLHEYNARRHQKIRTVFGSPRRGSRSNKARMARSSYRFCCITVVVTATALALAAAAGYLFLIWLIVTLFGEIFTEVDDALSTPTPVIVSTTLGAIFGYVQDHPMNVLIMILAHSRTGGNKFYGHKKELAGVKVGLKNSKQEGRITETRELLQAMRAQTLKPDVVSLTAVAECYTRRGDVDGALECLERFKTEVRLDRVFFKTVMNSCAGRGDVASTRMWIHAMQKHGFDADVASSNMVLKAYARSGDAEKALVWLQSMKERNEVSFNTAANACAKLGRLNLVLQIMEEMKNAQVTPDLITYTVALTACGNAQPVLWEEALELLQTMQQRNLELDRNALHALRRAGMRLLMVLLTPSQLILFKVVGAWVGGSWGTLPTAMSLVAEGLGIAYDEDDEDAKESKGQFSACRETVADSLPFDTSIFNQEDLQYGLIWMLQVRAAMMPIAKPPEVATLKFLICRLPRAATRGKGKERRAKAVPKPWGGSSLRWAEPKSSPNRSVVLQAGPLEVFVSGPASGLQRMPVQPRGWVTVDASAVGGPLYLEKVKLPRWQVVFNSGSQKGDIVVRKGVSLDSDEVAVLTCGTVVDQAAPLEETEDLAARGFRDGIVRMNISFLDTSSREPSSSSRVRQGWVTCDATSQGGPRFFEPMDPHDTSQKPTKAENPDQGGAEDGAWDSNRTWRVMNLQDPKDLVVVNKPEPFAPGSGKVVPPEMLVRHLGNGDVVYQVGHSKKVRGYMVMPIRIEQDEGWVVRRLVDRNRDHGYQVPWFEEIVNGEPREKRKHRNRDRDSLQCSLSKDSGSGGFKRCS